MAFTLFANGISITESPPAYSPAAFWLAASAVVSIVVTSWAMIATGTVHAPACATTLIVSLGLLLTPVQLGVIIVSVVILVEFHAGSLRVYKYFVGGFHPLYHGDQGQ